MVRLNSLEVKKIFGLVLVGMMVLGSSLLFAQPKEKPELPEQAGEVAEEKIEWLWKKDFPEEIKDMIIETKKVKKKALKEGKETEIEEEITYPKAVITENGLRFFDENVEEKKFISLQDIAPPDWKKEAKKSDSYIGVLSNKLRHNEERLSEAKFTMIDSEGNILWGIDISKVGYGMPYISPNGEYIICTGDITGDFTDYLPSLWNRGGMVKELLGKEFRETNKLDRLWVHKYSFDEKGNFFVLSGEEKIARHNKKFLSLFTSSGNEIWTKVYTEEEPSIVQVKMSKTGKYLLAITGKALWEETGEEKVIRGEIRKRRRHIGAKYYLEMFNRDGTVIWKKEVSPGNYNFVFSDSDDTVLVIVGNTKFRLETETGKEIK